MAAKEREEAVVGKGPEVAVGTGEETAVGTGEETAVGTGEEAAVGTGERVVAGTGEGAMTSRRWPWPKNWPKVLWEMGRGISSNSSFCKNNI